jgi:hypothetical protein
VSTEVSVLAESEIERIARPWWTIWAGMHWGFRDHACVLWCAAGRISPLEAFSVLGIDSFHPVDMVLFYREMVEELKPERELAAMIVDQMPLAERKHMRRFYAGQQVFEAGNGRRRIADLFNEVFKPACLPYLRESDDSEKSRVADLRNFTEGLRRTNLMRSDDPPIAQSKTPLIFISRRCAELIKTLPSLQYDDKKREDSKIVGNEEDSIWESAKTCFREYPNVIGSLPRYVRRQQAIDSASTPQGRLLNAIKFDQENNPGRIIKRR